MLFLDAIVILAGIGCATAIAKMLIEKFGFASGRLLQAELRIAQDRIALLERENRHLEEQVEWHKRLVQALEGNGTRASGEKAAAPLPERTTAG